MAQQQKPIDVHAETVEAVGDDKHGGAGDKAGKLLREAGHSVVVTPADNKRILRKVSPLQAAMLRDLAKLFSARLTHQ